jgi:hypothetical protein
VSSVKVAKAKPAPAEELADAIHETLQKSTDLPACRRLIEQVNVSLTRPNSALKPQGLPDELKTQYAKDLALTPRELDEIARGEYTPLDAYALEEAFLFHDIARALDVAALPAVERARAALDWVVRNVRAIESSSLAAPPTFVVMRGAGSGLERTYVLLSLLRQLDLDAALLGDASGQPSGIWGVVVRTDDGLFVFDARLGLPLPGPGGGIATLAEVRNNESVFQPLLADAKLPYDVTPARAKASHVFVSEPLSALAPRLKALQPHLPQNSGRIVSDWRAIHDRFRTALKGPGLEGCEVRPWASPAPDTWQRVLMAFLPPSDGGTDRVDAGPSRRDRLLFEQVPWKLLPPFLLQLAGEPGDRIRASFATRALALRHPGQARDLLLRGLFPEATEQLVALQSKLSNRTMNDRDMDERSREWADKAREAYADLLRAERAAKSDPAAAAAIADIRERIDAVWKNSTPTSMYLDTVSAPFINEEATYILALSKHEQAERLGHRTNAAKDPAAWETTRKWWVQFLNTYPNSAAAGPARRNLALALTAEGNAAAAKAEFLALAAAETLTPLERLACLVRAGQIK